VLKLALAVPEPAKFLPGPSSSVDWRAGTVKPDADDDAAEEQRKPPTLDA
jgi:hypothetical protein